MSNVMLPFQTIFSIIMPSEISVEWNEVWEGICIQGRILKRIMRKKKYREMKIERKHRRNVEMSNEEKNRENG